MGTRGEWIWGCCSALVLPAGPTPTGVRGEVGWEEDDSVTPVQGQPFGAHPSPLPMGWFPLVLRGLPAACASHAGLTLPLPTLVFLEIVDEKSRHSLQENMGKIKAPTQVIWGKQDQVHRHLLALGSWGPHLHPCPRQRCRGWCGIMCQQSCLGNWGEICCSVLFCG